MICNLQTPRLGHPRDGGGAGRYAAAWSSTWTGDGRGSGVMFLPRLGGGGGV